MNAAVIANPNAGLLRRRPELLAEMVQMAGAQAEICLTHDTDILAKTAARLARDRCQHVAIVGGDGTASATLTAIAAAYGDTLLPSVSLLRGGTMNTVANGLGVARGQPHELLRGTLEAWRTPAAAKVCARPAMRIGDRLGFLFGTGVMYGYLAAYYAAGDGRPSPITAARVFGHALASALVDGETYKQILNPTRLRVEFGSGAWETRTYMTVCAGTVDQAGLGFRVFNRAFEAEDRFHLIAIKGSPARVARDLPGVWWGRGLRAETAYEALAGRAEVRSEGGSFGYFVDGDLYQAPDRLTLSLGPIFRFLLPRRARI